MLFIEWKNNSVLYSNKKNNNTFSPWSLKNKENLKYFYFFAIRLIFFKKNYRKKNYYFCKHKLCLKRNDVNKSEDHERQCNLLKSHLYFYASLDNIYIHTHF